MEKSNSIIKGTMIAYLITIVSLLIYNAVLSFSDLSGDSIAMSTAIITTISAAVGGLYASMKIGEKGLIYGLFIGFLYISCLALVSYLAKDNFILTINTLYKVLLVTLAGGIGGVIGVNFK